VILVDIATGRMSADGAIPDDRTLQSLRHAPPAPRLPCAAPTCRWAVPRAVRCTRCAARRRAHVATVARAGAWRPAVRLTLPCRYIRNDDGLELRAALGGCRLHAHGGADGGHVHHGPRREPPRQKALVAA
jgi:hypothetical protein